MLADHPGAAVCAGGYGTARPRYRHDSLDVRHAHGYVVQTLADLGIVGIMLSLLALGAWWVSATRATGLRRRDRGLPFSPERIGLLTMFTVVIIFGVHSFVDWTWFVPGNALVALLCGGWLAGRGPLAPPTVTGLELRPRAWLADRWRLVLAATAIAVALTAA